MFYSSWVVNLFPLKKRRTFISLLGFGTKLVKNKTAWKGLTSSGIQGRNSCVVELWVKRCLTKDKTQPFHIFGVTCAAMWKKSTCSDSLTFLIFWTQCCNGVFYCRTIFSIRTSFILTCCCFSEGPTRGAAYTTLARDTCVTLGLTNASALTETSL